MTSLRSTMIPSMNDGAVGTDVEPVYGMICRTAMMSRTNVSGADAEGDEAEVFHGVARLRGCAVAWLRIGATVERQRSTAKRRIEVDDRAAAAPREAPTQRSSAHAEAADFFVETADGVGEQRERVAHLPRLLRLPSAIARTCSIVATIFSLSVA